MRKKKLGKPLSDAHKAAISAGRRRGLKPKQEEA